MNSNACLPAVGIEIQGPDAWLMLGSPKRASTCNVISRGLLSISARFGRADKDNAQLDVSLLSSSVVARRRR